MATIGLDRFRGGANLNPASASEIQAQNNVRQGLGTSAQPGNTLTNFGVPTGITGNTGRDRGGLLMPKLKYRFRVMVFNFGATGTDAHANAIDFTQQVISTGKPKITHETVELHTYNSRAYVAGKHQWEEITITLRDDISNSVNRLAGSQLQRQMNHFEQTTFGAGINYKFDTVIDVLDGGNVHFLERWFLEGCWLSNIGYGDMDYATSEAQTIELTVRYDNATQDGGLMPTLFNEGQEAAGIQGVKS